jgi:hypothetical protein
MVPERSRKTGRSSRFSPDLVQHTPKPLNVELGNFSLTELTTQEGNANLPGFLFRPLLSHKKMLL